MFYCTFYFTCDRSFNELKGGHTIMEANSGVGGRVRAREKTLEGMTDKTHRQAGRRLDLRA